MKISTISFLAIALAVAAVSKSSLGGEDGQRPPVQHVGQWGHAKAGSGPAVARSARDSGSSRTPERTTGNAEADQRIRNARALQNTANSINSQLQDFGDGVRRKAAEDRDREDELDRRREAREERLRDAENEERRERAWERREELAEQRRIRELQADDDVDLAPVPSDTARIVAPGVSVIEFPTREERLRREETARVAAETYRMQRSRELQQAEQIARQTEELKREAAAALQLQRSREFANGLHTLYPSETNIVDRDRRNWWLSQDERLLEGVGNTEMQRNEVNKYYERMREIGRETTSILKDNIFDQLIHEGEIDLDEAARSGIQQKIDEIKNRLFDSDPALRVITGRKSLFEQIFGFKGDSEMEKNLNSVLNSGLEDRKEAQKALIEKLKPEIDRNIDQIDLDK